jgi:Fe-S-cluster containining protein
MNSLDIFTWILLAVFVYFFVLRPFIYRLKKFKCQRCGQCCRLRVRLSEGDIRRLEKEGKKNFVEDKKWLKRVNGYCKFLEIKKGIAKCTVYNARPNICRWWPIRKFTFDTRCRTCHRI